jgi:hypothetical protein
MSFATMISLSMTGCVGWEPWLDDALSVAPDRSGLGHRIFLAHIGRFGRFCADPSAVRAHYCP